MIVWTADWEAADGLVFSEVEWSWKPVQIQTRYQSGGTTPEGGTTPQDGTTPGGGATLNVYFENEGRERAGGVRLLFSSGSVHYWIRYCMNTYSPFPSTIPHANLKVCILQRTFHYFIFIWLFFLRCTLYYATPYNIDSHRYFSMFTSSPYKFFIILNHILLFPNFHPILLYNLT